MVAAINTVRPAIIAPIAPFHKRTALVDRRERDFGTGYGRSSGYAAPRRYVRVAELSRFRLA